MRILGLTLALSSLAVSAEIFAAQSPEPIVTQLAWQQVVERVGRCGSSYYDYDPYRPALVEYRGLKIQYTRVPLDDLMRASGYEAFWTADVSTSMLREMGSDGEWKDFEAGGTWLTLRIYKKSGQWQVSPVPDPAPSPSEPVDCTKLAELQRTIFRRNPG